MTGLRNAENAAMKSKSQPYDDFGRIDSLMRVAYTAHEGMSEAVDGLAGLHWVVSGGQWLTDKSVREQKRLRDMYRSSMRSALQEVWQIETWLGDAKRPQAVDHFIRSKFPYHEWKGEWDHVIYGRGNTGVGKSRPLKRKSCVDDSYSTDRKRAKLGWSLWL